MGLQLVNSQEDYESCTTSRTARHYVSKDFMLLGGLAVLSKEKINFPGFLAPSSFVYDQWLINLSFVYIKPLVTKEKKKSVRISI